MKLKTLIIILISLISTNVYSQNTRNHGVILNFYNEPLIKPGVTLGFDNEYLITKNHRFGLTTPSITYFNFPLNYQAIYIYPELSYRFISNKGFYTGISYGAGLSMSQKIVPVYNLDGKEITPQWKEQLFMTSVLSFGWDFQTSNNKPFRAYFNIGWKGIYPDNLGVLNQPTMQLGLRYNLFSGSKK